MSDAYEEYREQWVQTCEVMGLTYREIDAVNFAYDCGWDGATGDPFAQAIKDGAEPGDAAPPWMGLGTLPDDLLPPTHPRGQHRPREACAATYRGHRCTLQGGHTSDHIARDANLNPVATWKRDR